MQGDNIKSGLLRYGGVFDMLELLSFEMRDLYAEWHFPIEKAKVHTLGGSKKMDRVREESVIALVEIFNNK